MMTPYVVTRYYRAPEVILGMGYSDNGQHLLCLFFNLVHVYLRAFCGMMNVLALCAYTINRLITGLVISVSSWLDLPF